MKKNRHKLFHSSFLVLLLFAVFPLCAYSNDLLNTKIHISRNKGTIYQLLQEVSGVSGYLFVYDSKLINNDKTIKIPDREFILRDIIYTIIGNYEIEMKIMGKHILLYQAENKQHFEDSSLPNNSNEYYQICGTIRNQITKEPVSSATISIENEAIGTISNQDGSFKLLIPDSLKTRNVVFSQLGYKKQQINVLLFQGRNLDLFLEPDIIPLQEVVVRVSDPISILENMLSKRNLNYNTLPVYITGFYREGTSYKRSNISITEAVLSVYKQSITNDNDQVKLLKKRRIKDQNIIDTLMPKVKSGINACLMLDIIKSDPNFLSDVKNNSFHYSHEDIVTIGDRQANVISFEPKFGMNEIYRGRLYVDTENNALLQAELESDPKHIEEVTRVFVIKNNPKYNISVINVEYSISYRQINDLYYINHVRGDLYFKVKKKHQLFSSPLHIWFEMVSCEVNSTNVKPFSRSERISTENIFADIQFSYDDNFWGNFNTIIPEKELRESIIKILKNTSNLTYPKQN